MAPSFSRSIVAVRSNDPVWAAAKIGGACVMLCAWFAWMFVARVKRYELSETARVEVALAAHRVAAPVSGQVASVNLVLDTAVSAGDVLVELDTEPLRLALEEKQSLLHSKQAQARLLASEITEREVELRATDQAQKLQVREAQARVREAEELARTQEAEAARAAHLHDEGLVTESDALRAGADARGRRIAVEAQRDAAAHAEVQRRIRGSKLLADLTALRRESAALDGEIKALYSAELALRQEIGRRKIRAPVAGRIGDIAVLRAGAFLKEGDPVAAVIPSGEVRVVAEFPLSSVGRLRVGQAASVRLDAFFWAEFGSVRATVGSIGTEAKDGRVRVELALQSDSLSRLPVQHGLSGRVMVEVEEVSPAVLVLRAAGQLLRSAEEARP